MKKDFKLFWKGWKTYYKDVDWQKMFKVVFREGKDLKELMKRGHTRSILPKKKKPKFRKFSSNFLGINYYDREYRLSVRLSAS
ncbi:MAG TPA: hypothetical protein DEV81_13780 [Cyanobacteria bacterium UBA11049]|nr:hypothetical protein [Cyanobacteria bacterium UBA11049]